MVEGETTHGEDAPAGAPLAQEPTHALETAPTQETAAPSEPGPEVDAAPGVVSEPEMGVAAASVPTAQFADLRGFQFLGAAPTGEPETYAQELAKELTARAVRFAQSVDDSIILASDGVIRWLGDPVARLAGGDELLKPKALLLADDALPAEGREAAQNRLNLWIAAHIRKVLGPLEGLAEPGAVADPVRELAVKVAEALGVLERERVRQQVKALDQSARSALRKLGVRFGATYIYVPALLKPGARTLCSQLWGLKRGAEAGADRLLAFAAAGRTSFASEAPLGPDSYRIAGFRLCGDRVVRIDIVERLTDLIRAAIPDQMRPGGSPASEAAGFAVTPQMTSLTGCAGESFASILRSLGYESHKVRKADFEAAMHKPQAEPAAPQAAAETASIPAEPAEAETPPATETLSEAAATPPAAEAALQPESAAPEAEARAPEQPEVEARASETEASETEALATEEPATDEPAAEAPAAAEPETSSEPVPAEAAPAAAEEEWIEVWRPAPRRRHQPPPRHNASPAADGAARPAWRSRDARRRHGGERQDAAAAQPQSQAPTSAPEAAAPAGEGAAEARREDGRSQHRHGGRRPRRSRGRARRKTEAIAAIGRPARMAGRLRGRSPGRKSSILIRPSQNCWR